MGHSHLFGPVRSRRLGMSLGINLLPHKTCSEDCIYCECGKTTFLTHTRQEFFPLDDILGELRQFLSHSPTLDVITFAGSGEPLLYSRFGELVQIIKQEFPQYQLCLLTNGTLLADAALWSECQLLDIIVPSVDAATQEVFERINRPHHCIHIDHLLSQLSRFSQQFPGEIWLEILLLFGVNDHPDHLHALAQACAAIRHDRIQLGTLDRPGTIQGLTKLTYDELQQIARTYFSNAQIVSRPDVEPATKCSHEYLGREIDIESAIADVLQIRPSTLDDLLQTIGRHHQREIEGILASMSEKKVICTDQDFYRWRR